MSLTGEGCKVCGGLFTPCKCDLRARVDALEAEIARLREQFDEACRRLNDADEENARLREALQAILDLGREQQWASDIARGAIATEEKTK